MQCIRMGKSIFMHTMRAYEGVNVSECLEIFEIAHRMFRKG